MGHRTMRGKEVDMEKLMRQNELMPAIGNMQVNARGDQLGPGGKIVKKREEVVAEYYADNPNANIQQPPRSAKKAETPKPAQASNAKPQNTKTQSED
jgi:hypothetical protein